MNEQPMQELLKSIDNIIGDIIKWRFMDTLKKLGLTPNE